MTDTQPVQAGADPHTGRPYGDHGTANEALAFALDHSDGDLGNMEAFLRAWREGSAFEEWPEFYAGLSRITHAGGSSELVERITGELIAGIGRGEVKAQGDAMDLLPMLRDHIATLTDELTRLREKVGSALADIAAERERQISGEGWTLEHDDAHDNGALAEAAACYAVGSNDIYRIGTNVRGNATVSRHLWPWDIKWWKPRTDRRLQLVKAGALIVAEIERLDRQALADQPK